MAEQTTPPTAAERLEAAGGATTTARYPLTSLDPATGEALATAAPHTHETRARAISIFDPTIVQGAIGSAFAKLDPRYVAKNPVMFVVEIGSLITTVVGVSETVRNAGDIGFVWAISVWLWFTVLFANFAEAMAEGRGKAQADTLRKTRSETLAKLEEADHVKLTPSSMLRKGDIVQCSPGDVIPGDGEVIEGIASVDESAITGESAPVIRESGGDRSAVTGGTRVLSDFIRVQITSNPGETFWTA